MQLKLERDIVFFDLETTGVNTTTARIVEIAVIKLTVDGEIIEKRYLINPEEDIPLEASEIHGITNEMVADKPPFRKYAKGIKDFFNGCDIGGFNSNSYDMNVLTEEFNRVGMQFLDWEANLIDVFVLYKKLHSSKLSEIYKRFFGEELDGAHNALIDVRATVKILFKMIDDWGLRDKTTTELSEYIYEDKPICDFAGLFYKKDGEVYWSFGKHKDCTITSTIDDKGYISWFLGSDFPTNSKNFLKKYL